MRAYNHLSICGALVSTRERPENIITKEGKPLLNLNQEEFEQALRGILQIGRIYLSAASSGDGVSLFLPTKNVLLDENGEILRIRSEKTLAKAIGKIRSEGPAFLQ